MARQVTTRAKAPPPKAGKDGRRVTQKEADELIRKYGRDHVDAMIRNLVA